MATPLAGKQAPGVYRLKVGAFEVTVLSDGNLAIDRPDVLHADIRAAPTSCWRQRPCRRRSDPAPASTSGWSIPAASLCWSMPAAALRSSRPLEKCTAISPPRASSRTRSMSSSSPTCIRTTSRACSRADGKMAFPNAVVHVAADEYAFWTSDEIRAKAPDEFKAFFDLAMAAIKPYADAGKVQMFKDGTTLAPGITAAAMPGHTVGHSMVRVSSDGSDFLIWRRHRALCRAAISGTRSRHRLRLRSGAGDRQPQEGVRHGGDRPAVVRRRTPTVSPVWATPPNPVPVTLTCR